MRIILNVGLARNDGKTVKVFDALWAIRNCGIVVSHAKVYDSATERTLVIEGECSISVEGRVCEVARLLKQDCIAVYFPDRNRGSLQGPNADAWGKFDPRFFVMPAKCER